MKKETRKKILNLILTEVEKQDGLIWRYVADLSDIHTKNSMRHSYTLFVTTDGFSYVDGFQADFPSNLKRFQDAEDQEIQEVFRDVFGTRRLKEVLTE